MRLSSLLSIQPILSIIPLMKGSKTFGQFPIYFVLGFDLSLIKVFGGSCSEAVVVQLLRLFLVLVL